MYKNFLQFCGWFEKFGLDFIFSKTQDTRQAQISYYDGY